MGSQPQSDRKRHPIVDWGCGRLCRVGWLPKLIGDFSKDKPSSELSSVSVCSSPWVDVRSHYEHFKRWIKRKIMKNTYIEFNAQILHPEMWSWIHSFYCIATPQCKFQQVVTSERHSSPEVSHVAKVWHASQFSAWRSSPLIELEKQFSKTGAFKAYRLCMKWVIFE